MKIGRKIKIFSIVFVTAAVLISLPFILYLNVLPKVVSSQKTANFVSESAKKYAGIDLEVKDSVLETSLKPVLGFRIGHIAIKKEDNEILNLENFGILLNFSEIFKKHIIIKELGADNIFIDVNKLSELGKSDKKETEPKQEFDWNIDIFSAKMFVKDCLIVFKAEPDTFIRFRGQDIEVNNQDKKNYIHFRSQTEFEKNNKKIYLTAADRDCIYIEDNKINVKDFRFFINRSKIVINAYADNKKNYYLKAETNNFDIKDVIEIVESNLIISNGSMLLAGFKDLQGSFNSKLVLTKNKIDGIVTLNNFSCILLPLNNLKLTLNEGRAVINNKDILLQDVKGYYGKSKQNTVVMNGGIYDYFKSARTAVTTNAAVTNEFAVNHLSKIVGYPFEIVGKGGSRIIFEALGDKMDLTAAFKLAKGQDILVDGMSLSPTSYDRAVNAVMHFKGNDINIEKIDYYIAENIQKGSKIKPILTVKGNVTMAGIIKDMGFEIPNPLPSEFLNLFVQGKVFKRGTIAGNLHYVNTGKVPTIQGDMKIQGMRIPAQRLFIKEATLKTNDSSIILSSNGRYRRTAYDISGDIKNALVFPIVVNNINLKIDDINIERILNSFNNQTASAQVNKEEFAVTEEIDSKTDEQLDNDDTAPILNPGLLVINRCILHVVKGSYKDINFGNVFANLTLDKDCILRVNSNRFDIAEGISSTKIECDLKKHLYSIKLGIKDVNSDIMATSLLALKREITGKASGLIELNTDDSLKLNGLIKFVVKDGTIQKIGLVEYILKFASLFRNPLAMISPATFSDLVNVPEGDFDKITGELILKDNVVEKINIKSQADQLSAFVVGRFDLETRDATLRIYTKMSNAKKGFAGALRNFSLNSLANRVPLSSRNDSNYYSAELSQLPDINADEKDCQVFLTTVDGDVEHNNFLSSLKRIK